MKNFTFFFLLLSLLTGSARAQVTYKDEYTSSIDTVFRKKLHNEVSFNTISLINLFTGSTGPTDLRMIYKHFNGANGVRFTLSYTADIENRTTLIPQLGFGAEDDIRNTGYSALVGYEGRQRQGILTVFYGVDLGYAHEDYSQMQAVFPDSAFNSRETIEQMETYDRAIAGPFIGLSLLFSRRLGLTIQGGANISYDIYSRENRTNGIVSFSEKGSGTRIDYNPLLRHIGVAIYF